jgi:hypothetical protein
MTRTLLVHVHASILVAVGIEVTLGMDGVSITKISRATRASSAPFSTSLPFLVTVIINGLYSCRSQEGDVAEGKNEKREELHGLQN